MIYNKYILYISIFIPSMRYMKKYIVISIVILIFTIGKVFETSAHYTVPHPKYVALTFDDGPDQTTTPLLLDILKANNIHATFFMIGEHAQQYPDIVKRVYDEWNMIGNHTRDHRDLTKLSSWEVMDEIQKTQEIIDRITGYTPILFRPPYGMQNRTILHISKLAAIQWSLDSEDWKLPSSGAMVQHIMKNVHTWSIILMHDTLSWTIQTLPSIINALQKSGYTIVTVGKLLGGYKYIHSGRIYRKGK